MAERLALLGQEPGDIETFSALLQDATLRLADVGLDRKARRLALLINRYRREADALQVLAGEREAGVCAVPNEAVQRVLGQRPGDGSEQDGEDHASSG
jgi:hypothetical protein